MTSASLTTPTQTLLQSPSVLLCDRYLCACFLRPLYLRNCKLNVLSCVESPSALLCDSVVCDVGWSSLRTAVGLEATTAAEQ